MERRAKAKGDGYKTFEDEVEESGPGQQNGTSPGDIELRRPVTGGADQNGDAVTPSAATYTVEEAVENMGFGRFQIKIFFICGLFSATDALEMLLLSVLTPMVRCEWMLSDFQVPFITTVVFIGMFLGSSMWGSWADKYGRFSICFIGAAWIAYFGVLTSFAPDYYWLIVLRLLVGFGFGGAIQSFTLMAEYMPSTYRAKVLIIYNFMWALGSCFEVLMAYLILPTWGWRYLVAVSALPMLITLLVMAVMPESARFLLAAGRKADAVKVLEAASKENGRQLPPGDLVQSKKVPRGDCRDLFSKEYAMTTLVLWLLWFGTAGTYYGIILLGSEMLENGDQCSADGANFNEFAGELCRCNLHTSEDYKDMIISTFGEFFAIPFNLLTIDTLGRKWTIAINYAAAGIFFILIQVCAGRIGLTVFMFGVRAFTAGIFNVIYIYTTEVYPTMIRSLGLGTSSAAARIGAMITPFIAQLLLSWSVKAATWVYGILCFLCAVATMALPIETMGRELKQTT